MATYYSDYSITGKSITTGGGLPAPPPLPSPSPPPVISTPPTVVPPESISTVTGIDPNEVAAATYGKIIPIFVGGMPRLGCHIIYGPTFTTTSGVTYASFGVSFGMPALNVGSGAREIRELRLDGFKVWSSTEGYLISGLTFRFYDGDETQAADPLVIAAYPSAPVAHKGHCCVFIENLALTDFNLKVPFVSAIIADILAVELTESGANFVTVDPTDGVNLGYALDLLSFSPYVGLGSNFNAGGPAYGWTTEDEFETEGISERVDALIVAEKVSFLELINRFARLHLWDVVQPDQLKIIERGTVAPDISLDFTSIIGSGDAPPILIERQPPSDRPRELDYSYIDIDRDYEINTVTAGRMSVPADATRSEGKDTISLPVVHTVQEASAWATLRLYKDELTRETISFTSSIVGYAIEPGDIVSVDARFKIYILRVLETLKGANWTNRIKAEPVLRCALPVGSAPLDGVACVTGAWSLSRNLLSTFDDARYSVTSSNITRITDQTGDGHHFNDGGASARPVLTTAGPNSRAAADFDGSNDYMDTATDLSAFTTNSASYVIVSLLIDAVTLTDADVQDNHAIIGDAGQKWGLYASATADLSIYAYNNNGSADSIGEDVDDIAIATATALVLSLRHEDGALYLRINNGDEVSVASGNTSDLTGDLRLAMSATGTNANAKIFEVTTFDCVPPEGTRDALEQDFMNWIGAETLEALPVVEDGAATTGEHRYWRCNVTSSNGAACSIVELQFWENSHTQHTTTGGTIIQSAVGAGGSAAAVFDGLTASGSPFWWSGGATGWIGYDFGSGVTKEVGMVALIGRVSPGQGPKTFTIDYSDDGAAWTTAWSIPDQDTLLTGASAKLRYYTDPLGGWVHWRLRWETDASGAVRIAAAELRREIGGADFSGDAFAKITDNDTVGTVTNIFDGSAATDWGSSGSFPTHVTCYFHGNMDIAEVLLQATATAGVPLTQAPDELYVDSSPDGGTWTNQYSTTGLAAWTASETRTFDVT